MVVKVPDDADGGIDPPIKGSGDRQDGVGRSCVAAVDQAWPSRGVPPGRVATAPSGEPPAPAWCACKWRRLSRRPFPSGSPRRKRRRRLRARAPLPETSHLAAAGRGHAEIRRLLATLAWHGRAPGRYSPTAQRWRSGWRWRPQESCTPYAAILLIYAPRIEMSIPGCHASNRARTMGRTGWPHARTVAMPQ